MASGQPQSRPEYEEKCGQSLLLASVPCRIERWRKESLALGIAFLINCIFLIAASSTDVYKYGSNTYSNMQITVSHTAVKICIPACTTYTLDRLCPALSQRVSTAGSFDILVVFISIIGLGVAAIEFVGRRFSPYLLVVLCAVSLVFHFFAWVLDAAAFGEKLCSNTSLMMIDFSYGPAFPLEIVSFFISLGTFIAYLIRRKLVPVKEYADN